MVDSTGSNRATGGSSDDRMAAQRIAEWVSGLRYHDVPTETIAAAKLHALDTIGVGIAAAVLPGEARTARASVALFSETGGREEASIIGLQRQAPAAHAAFANGSLQHSLDFDDIDTDSRVHASTIVTPAAFAMAERTGASGRELVTALVAGNEIATRIGMGGPIHFQKHGFHATPVAGIFGAVASSTSLLHLDASKTTDALGIAGDVAGGTNAWIARGTQNKHLHAGWAAHNGIVSALLAANGAEGPVGVFEGRYGLYEALTGHANVNMSHVLDTLGQTWETPLMAYKAYPSCYWMHGSLDAALTIRNEISSRIDEIDAVTAIVPTPAVTIVLEPRDTRIRPLTPYAGKFSLQFSVAAMLLRGTINLDTYSIASMADEAVLSLASRVGYTVSEKFDRGSQVYPGGLAVRMQDGSEYIVEVPEPRGTVLNPMNESDLMAKFRDTAGQGLEVNHIIELESALLHLETPGSVDTIVELLRRVRPLAR
jgi:2-methylcitrate dehydratase PrpD